ncbi:MAG: DUF4249 family protein [Bacteroidetes bacterium]|nr:DUF4249 family protein [Bacteroidota bacterium]
MKKLFVLFVFITTLFFGCKTDFEINAPWKETTVIYGLLDINQSVQMIKINKAFLGEGDANQFAQNPDSINYNPADLSVKMYQLKNGIAEKTLVLHDSLLPSKKPGDFTTQKNIVYVTYEKLDSSKTYKLEVTNLKSGNVCTATTPVLETVKYTKIGNNSYFVSFCTAPSTPVTNGTYADPIITWASKPNARTFQTNVRFFYTEKDVTTGIVETKYVDWLQSAVLSNAISGGEVLQQKLSGQGFYQYIASQIPVNGNVKRVASSFEFTISVGSDELYNYMNINSPSGDFNQEKPTYTNITNGLGLFSTRTNYKTIRLFCGTSPSGPKLCDATNSNLTELKSGKYTSQLGFDYQ